MAVTRLQSVCFVYQRVSDRQKLQMGMALKSRESRLGLFSLLSFYHQIIIFAALSTLRYWFEHFVLWLQFLNSTSHPNASLSHFKNFTISSLNITINEWIVTVLMKTAKKETVIGIFLFILYRGLTVLCASGSGLQGIYNTHNFYQPALYINVYLPLVHLYFLRLCLHLNTFRTRSVISGLGQEDVHFVLLWQYLQPNIYT